MSSSHSVHDPHLKHAHNASPYATSSTSVFADSQSERGEPIAHAEFKDPKYAATASSELKFAVASVRRENQSTIHVSFVLTFLLRFFYTTACCEW
jgi:hypothetical protein